MYLGEDTDIESQSQIFKATLLQILLKNVNQLALRDLKTPGNLHTVSRSENTYDRIQISRLQESSVSFSIVLLVSLLFSHKALHNAVSGYQKPFSDILQSAGALLPYLDLALC